MKYKFFAIPARYPEPAEAELNDFINQHRINFIEKQLVNDGADSFWSICVGWLEGEAAPSVSAGSRTTPTIDYKQVLNEADFSVYLELRNYRKQLADQYSLPAYALFTNEQLAAMVQQRVTTKAGLTHISGIGKARIDKYGDSFLQKLNQCWQLDNSEAGDETNPHHP